MARRFRVTFDLEFSYYTDPEAVKQGISDLLDSEDMDHTEVGVVVLDSNFQEYPSSDDVL